MLLVSESGRIEGPAEAIVEAARRLLRGRGLQMGYRKSRIGSTAGVARRNVGRTVTIVPILGVEWGYWWKVAVNIAISPVCSGA